MESKIEDALNASNKRQHLIDVLDKLLKESNFYGEIIAASEKLVEKYAGNYRELCDRLCDYVYENMPERARAAFEKEIQKFVDHEIHPLL